MEQTSPQFLTPLDPCNLPIQRCPVPRQKASKRILIIKFGALGDVLMATPLLAALRHSYPEAYLTWLVEYSNKEAIDANPFVDEVITWNGHFWKDLLAERWKRMLHRKRFLGVPWLLNAMKMRQELRRRRIDILISFHPEQWPTLTRNAGQREAIGVFESTPSSQWDRPPNSHLYNVAYVGRDLPSHRTEKSLLPLQALGVPLLTSKKMVLGYTRKDEEAVQTLLMQDEAAPNAPHLVVIAPMTTWSSKCWPPENYAALGDALASDHDCRIVLIGTNKEREAVESIAGRMQVRPIVAAGTLEFRQVAALLARASLVVSGDTGPMHAAAAVGTPYIALFGPTMRDGLAPIDSRGIALAYPVPCGPCGHMVCPNIGDDYMRCLNSITVDEVLAAATQFIPARLHC